MIRTITAIIARDLRISLSQGGFWLPLIFYISAATLFPFAVGPDKSLLLQTGGGVLWITALFATLLPLDRLIQPDIDDGIIDQWVTRGISDEVIALCKLISHWLSFGPPLLVAALLASLMMGLEGSPLSRLLLSLGLASPGLAGLAIMIASLTAGLRGASAVGGLLLLPLAIPMLIFGAGSLSGTSNQALLFLSAVSLLLTAIAPLVGGAALRAGRE